MIQIICQKEDPNMGNVKVKIRIKGKIIFFKFNQSEIANQIMAKMQKAGAIITPGKGWIKVNIFGENKEIKLGTDEFNVNDKTDSEIEKILGNFYIINYTKTGFTCENKNI